MICQYNKCKKRTFFKEKFCRQHKRSMVYPCLHTQCNNKIDINHRYCANHICKELFCNNKNDNSEYCKECICMYCGRLKKRKHDKICLHCMCLNNVNYSPCLNLAEYDYSNSQLIHQLTDISNDVIKYLIIPMAGFRSSYCENHS